MESQIEKTLAQLDESSKLSTEEDFETYSKVIEKLQGNTSEEVLRRMLRCFRDVEDNGIQYELVKLCESYPAEMYIASLLKEGPNILDQTAKWYELLLRRVLNNETYVAKLYSVFCALNGETRTFSVNYISLLAKNSSLPDKAKYLQNISQKLSRIDCPSSTP